MIQRLQTVFLLLAIISLGLFLWLPLVGVETTNFTDATSGWQISHTLRITGEPYIYFINLILTGSAMGLSFIAIFMFKYRSLQSMLCWFAIPLIAGAEAFVYFKYTTRVFRGDVLLTPWNLLALVAIAFHIAAIIYIRKDEKLIQSVDRLR